MVRVISSKYVMNLVLLVGPCSLVFHSLAFAEELPKSVNNFIGRWGILRFCDILELPEARGTSSGVFKGAGITDIFALHQIA